MGIKKKVDMLKARTPEWDIVLCKINELKLW